MNAFVALPALPTRATSTNRRASPTCSAAPSDRAAVSRRTLVAAALAATAVAAVPAGGAQAEGFWAKITGKNATVKPVGETAVDKDSATKSKIVDKEAKQQAAENAGPKGKAAAEAAKGAAQQLKK